MLVPQFSIRWLLGVTAVAAVIFSIVALGVRGHHWAAAVSVGLLALAMSIGLYGLLFFVVWVFSVAAAGRVASPGDSPFARGRRPAETPSPRVPVEQPPGFAERQQSCPE